MPDDWNRFCQWWQQVFQFHLLKNSPQHQMLPHRSITEIMFPSCLVLCQTFCLGSTKNLFNSHQITIVWGSFFHKGLVCEDVLRSLRITFWLTFISSSGFSLPKHSCRIFSHFIIMDFSKKFLITLCIFFPPKNFSPKLQFSCDP